MTVGQVGRVGLIPEIVKPMERTKMLRAQLRITREPGWNLANIRSIRQRQRLSPAATL